MRLLIHEFVTGGGLFTEPTAPPPAGSLAAEGAAMLTAVAADFVKAGVTVEVLRDRRLKLSLPECEVVDVGAGEELGRLAERASRADATLLIAPEFDGLLLERCRVVERCGARLLSPSAEFVAIASDKDETAERLRGGGVPVPDAVRIEPHQRAPRDFAFPAVLKPPDGAGSQDVRLVRSAAEMPAVTRRMRLERFCPGQAASIAVLCGPRENVPLPACAQHLSDDGHFRYLGGRVPLAPPLHRRAARLALSALRCLPPTVGYVGLDLVLGESADGRDDVVIEVNPRLTTSYVGLRRLARSNLAAAMRAVACGEEAGLEFDESPLDFRP